MTIKGNGTHSQSGFQLFSGYISYSTASRDQARKIAFLHDQTSPCSELKEKFKCIEYIDKDENRQKLLPKIRGWLFKTNDVVS